MAATLALPQRVATRAQVNPWVVALTVTLATFMELLDTSIANVSLPYIAGGLGRSQPANPAAPSAAPAALATSTVRRQPAGAPAA